MRGSEKDQKLSLQQISGPWAEIDLGAITRNLSQIRTLTGERPLMPVIKANAYGHGLIEVARHLEGLSVAGVCVGRLGEALALRRNNIRLPVLNLGGISRDEAAVAVEQGIIQAVFGDEVRDLDREARQAASRAVVHVKVDTGLGRVGVPYRGAQAYLRQVADLRHVQIAGIFTSLTEDPQYDRIQLERFQDVWRQAEASGLSLGLKHAASSAAILENPEALLDLARPGIMLFGHYPSRREYTRRRIDLSPALSFKTRGVCIKELAPGASVAYHQGFIADRALTLVTGGVGYADGYPLDMVPGGEVLIRGRRHPLVAAVTANHIYINAGDCRGIDGNDEVVLLGRQGREFLGVEEWALVTGRSEYQLLTGISPTVPRYYRSCPT